MNRPSWLERAITEFDAAGFRDGDLLSRDWLTYALDIPPARTLKEAADIQWMTLNRVEAFKELMLVERKIALRTERGHGYRVLPPADQAEHAAREAMGLMLKGMEKGAKIMRNTRTELLTDTEKRRHTDTEIRLAGISQMMRRQRKDVFLLFAPGEPKESKQ